MKQSFLFTKTRKEAPADEVSKNAQLLIRAGYIHKQMAGAYELLPLGLRALQNVQRIVREEINNIGGQEVSLTALQDKTNWEKSDRWNDEVVDVWFKTKLKNDTEIGLATTHEEPMTAIMKDHVQSYRDLPFSVYQFQTKFRNELRSKSGMMRGREFLMKDLYSFSRTQEEHQAFYDSAAAAYKKIFARLGIGEKTYFTFARGGSFAPYSHEFQTLSDAGEDTIYCCDTCMVAVNSELYDEQKTCPQCGSDSIVERKAIEVGNIFSLGTKFSDALELSFVTEVGEKMPVIMGSYGIGIGRVLGTIVEVLSDEKGIVLPQAVAPFVVHLISLGESEVVKTAAADIYENLRAQNIEVLWDDRALRPGEKFADSDLIGIPHRFVVSEKTCAQNVVEYKSRTATEAQLLPLSDYLSVIK
jgi:prolyl-tRNA synthetase